MNSQTTQFKVTGRHITMTNAIRDYAIQKLESIGMDFPRVIDAHVILDVEKYRHRCEIVLACTGHIHIKTHAESNDMYASIDLSVNKLARRMRKYKTKVQRHHRPHRNTKESVLLARVLARDHRLSEMAPAFSQPDGLATAYAFP